MVEPFVQSGGTLAVEREAHAVADAAQAAALADELVEPGDVVLVKGSRGVGLEVVAETLAAVATASPPEARA
jgi:UDP-N-acetylmuramyl pentapeptide synthase